ncbi:MAG: YihY/virulence factor BrkB family protein [Chloroflexi bacterium]|nr:YihY/virulence factor BrkB family protein [Chloroflexota bacterium]
MLWTKRLYALLKGTIKGFIEHNCIHWAASISYYILLSIFPLALALISILGFIVGRGTVEEDLVTSISNLMPGSKDFIASTIHGIVQTREATGLVATIGLIWISLGVFSAIRRAINVVWGTTPKGSFFLQKLTDLGMMAGVGTLFVLSIIATGLARYLRRLTMDIPGAPFLVGANLWSAFSILMPLAITFVTFLLLYRFVPNAKVRWGDIWPGALAATVGFEVIKNGFAWYLQTFALYNVVYGSVGVVVAFLTWAYLSANVLLFGAELSAHYPKVMALYPRRVSVTSEGDLTQASSLEEGKTKP